MSIENEIAQEAFLYQGGIYARILAKMKEDGRIPRQYVFHEYPKVINIDNGTEEVSCSTETCKGREIHWTETRRVVESITVGSEEEEERVLAGGKTSAQIEVDRQDLFRRCAGAGIHADPSWSAVRLRRELGDKMDAPEPVNNMARLEAELAALKKMAAMQAEIEALKAQLARPPEDADAMRAELASLGVKADGRWSISRLREELDRATAPTEGVG